MDVWFCCFECFEVEFLFEDVYIWLKLLQVDLCVDSLVFYVLNVFIVDQVCELYLVCIKELLMYFVGFGDVFFEIGLCLCLVELQIVLILGFIVLVVLVELLVLFVGNLDLYYIFVNFVEGCSNQLGLVVVFQVVQKFGDCVYNLLLLYGGIGLGKIYLMFVVGNVMCQVNLVVKVFYLCLEQFFSVMICVLQEKIMDQFKCQFQQVDVLLIDDIQFFVGKDWIQEEFFYMFNVLFDGKQQIILICDWYLCEVEGLEVWLKLWLVWGLLVVIELLDFEICVVIVFVKVCECGVEIFDDVVFLIVKKMCFNVCDFEGVLNMLIVCVNFIGCVIIIDFVQEILCDLLCVQQQVISIFNIQKIVVDYYGLQIKDLLFKCWIWLLVCFCQVVMVLIKELIEYSLLEIGDVFVGWDYIMVLYVCCQICMLMEIDGKLREDWDKLIWKLSE